MLLSFTPPSAMSTLKKMKAFSQVAAHAEHHLRVRKAEGGDGRMLTVIQPLTEPQERATEVAAMLGLGLPAAEQMLAEAQK